MQHMRRDQSVALLHLWQNSVVFIGNIEEAGLVPARVNFRLAVAFMGVLPA